MGACTSQPSETENLIDPVAVICQPVKGASYRGLKLGESFQEVLSTLDTLPELKSDTLIIMNVYSTDSQLHAKIYYSFDEYGLFEIQSDVFSLDGDYLDESRNLLQAYFTERFGNKICDGNTCNWTTFSKNNNIVEITMSMEVSELDTPFLSINFLEPLDDEF